MYLTAEQATARIAEYNLEGPVTEAFVELATDELEFMHAGWIGTKYDPDQDLSFPRSVTVAGDTEGVVPERILNWVAITAYQLQEDDEPAVRAERVKNISEQFVRGREAQPSRIKKRLLRPYRVRSVRIR